MNCESVAEWLTMAKRSPNQTAAALRKACSEAKAINAAEGMACGYEAAKAPTYGAAAVSSLDELKCRYCEYSSDSRTAMQCHESRLHGHVNDVTRCIDTARCSVCALTFESIDGNMSHVYKSDVCRLNHLLRGPFLEGEALRDVLAEASEFRRSNSDGGRNPRQISKICVRAFGPHQIIMNQDGNCVVPSKKGNPLGGSNRLHLPGHLTEFVEKFDFPCQGARYTVCTAACLLCRGGVPPICTPAS